MKQLLTMAGFVLASTLTFAQGDFSSVKIETTKVAERIYMLQGRGGNIGVSAGEDGVVLIDDQYAPLTAKIEAAIDKITDRPVRFVLNTHWHGDHTGGNEYFGKTGGVIVAHDNVRKRLSSEQVIEFFDATVEPKPEDALPVLTFSDQLTVHLNGEPAVAHHVAHAHTDGDIMIHFPESNVLHMGDIFFNQRYPFIDLGSGGSLQGMIDGAARGLELADEDTRIIPGHGALADRDDLQFYHDMLVTIRKRVQAMIDDGKSLEQVITANPTQQYDGEWGQNFIDPEDIVTFAYESLSSD